MFNSWMPVSRNLGTRGELNADCKRYRLVHRAFNDGHFGVGWQPRSILPLKFGRRQQRVCACMRILRIRLWYQGDAKAAQEGGGCCSVFHELSPLEFSDRSATAQQPAPVVGDRLSCT